MPLFLTSDPARYEAVLRGCGTSLVCLLYAKATVFQLYHGSDITYEMKRRKSTPTLLLTQGIVNLPEGKRMAWEELAFDVVEIQIYRGDGIGRPAE